MNAPPEISDAHRARWAALLARVAAQTLGPGLPPEPPETIAGFADELGHRRDADGPFLWWRAVRAGLAAGPTPIGVPAGRSRAATVPALFAALTDPALDPASLLALADAGPSGDSAPLLATPTAPPVAIEVATENELAAIHACWGVARLRGDGALAARTEAAARYVVETLQPDNATGHPWGVHVFAGLRSPEGEAYAATLLHNAQVALGRPDRLSAHILADAAMWLGFEPLG